MSSHVTLFVPVLNEIEGMRATLPHLQPQWYDQIIIADGGSSDGSLEYAQSLGMETYVQKRRGIRFAYWKPGRSSAATSSSPSVPMATVPSKRFRA